MLLRKTVSNTLRFYLVVILFSAVLLAGCGGQQKAEEKQPEPAKQAPAAQAPKEDAAAFYKDKNLEFLVPYGPGGGYDEYARAMAPFLKKYTGATVVVVNKPGAGGLVAINDLYRAKPDGLSMAIINGTGAAQGQLTGDEGVHFDLTKFSWLGNVVVDAQVYYLSKKSGLKSMEDMLKAGKVTFGATGAGGNTYTNIVLFAEALRPIGLDTKLVMGYGSSNETRLAMMRGDIDGNQGSYSSAADALESGEAVAVAQLGKKRAPEMPQVHLVTELKGLPQEGKDLIQIADNMMLAGRPIIAPPGVPAARVNFLREGIAKVLSDKEFLENAKRQKLAIGPQSGEEIAKTIKELLGISDAVKGKMKAAMDKYRQ